MEAGTEYNHEIMALLFETYSNVARCFQPVCVTGRPLCRLSHTEVRRYAHPLEARATSGFDLFARTLNHIVFCLICHA